MQDEAPDEQPGGAGPPASDPGPGQAVGHVGAVATDRPLDAPSSPDPVAAGDALALAGPRAARSVAAEVRNEAIPAVPPEAGTARVGSIPAAHARAVWSRLQASNWRLFLIRFLCAGLAVVVTVAIVPGLGFTGWTWGQFTRIAVIFGLLNATVKPLLQFLVLRFIFSTYGIVVVIINMLLLLLLAAILDDTFEVFRPLALVLGGLVVGVVGLILETLLGATPPVLDRDYKERNGLR
ncbi:MAG: phage holin family protein [Candidatus Nanopelagicales bacterium]|jgi:putative membrane protein|nr:phage holin family protein [Candidatus Nanopelagicales bacterium]